MHLAILQDGIQGKAVTRNETLAQKKKNAQTQ
jgi:hypothetical protein